MEIPDRDALGRFVRERHVHYDVAREDSPADEASETTGFEVRLFAADASSRLEPPGSARHVELLAELRSFAERLLGSHDAASRTEIVPTTAPPLYRSTEVPDADEAALTLRVRCHAPEHRQGGEDRCLGEIRQRLDALGVPRR